MKVKRLRIRLPVSMNGSAETQSRAIAEAVGRQVAAGATIREVKTPSFGHRGATLGAQVAQVMKGGRNGG